MQVGPRDEDTLAENGIEIPETIGKRNYSKIAEKSNFSGQDISWATVNFTVGSKNILRDCWGKCSVGQVCAIMGPSGSGKSSLLNVLAGRSASASGINIHGSFKVGDMKINPVEFRSRIAYVMQDDALMATSTPREALTFSASLRLPSEYSKAEIDELVEKTLSNLGLLDCADVMIGGALIKGISGGQRKRTSVGVEIITNPTLLFLDEPTSGLDSVSALNCVTLLKDIAKKDAAVLCTIHQPSSEVFFLFDILILMKEGQVFYSGPVDSLVTYFSSRGLDCPKNYNPSDFAMSINQQYSVEELKAKGFFEQDSAVIKNASSDNLAALVDGDGKAKTLTTPTIYRSSIYKQLVWLIYREVLNTKRDVAALIGRFGVTSFLSLLLGLIFYGAGSKDDSDPDNFSTHFGAVTFSTIMSMFGAAQPVMLTFPFERPMFMRDNAAAYYISKILVELPITLAQVICQYLLIYFLCDLQGEWIFLVLACWGLAAASSSVAMALGAAVPNVKDVTELAPLLFVPQLLFAGFFIRTSQIPVFLRWAQYLCAIKYTINLMLIIEFEETLPSCQGGARPYCLGVLDNNDIEAELWWLYLLLIAVLFLAFRFVGALILIYKAKRFF